jgi:hypothetical protein
MGMLTRVRAGWHGRGRTALLGLSVLALITVAVPAGTAAAASKLWKIQPTANVTAPQGMVNGISCLAADSCEAVGEAGAKLVAEAWNGTGWTAQAVPVPAGAASPTLTGRSCVSAAFCEAVGSRQQLQ